MPNVQIPTRRHLEILTLLAEGLTREQIGERLFISANTVKSHLHTLASELGARNAVHLVTIFYQKGWLAFPSPPTGCESRSPTTDLPCRLPNLRAAHTHGHEARIEWAVGRQERFLDD